MTKREHARKIKAGVRLSRDTIRIDQRVHWCGMDTNGSTIRQVTNNDVTVVLQVVCFNESGAATVKLRRVDNGIMTNWVLSRELVAEVAMTRLEEAAFLEAEAKRMATTLATARLRIKRLKKYKSDKEEIEAFYKNLVTATTLTAVKKLCSGFKIELEEA